MMHWVDHLMFTITLLVTVYHVSRIRIMDLRRCAAARWGAGRLGGVPSSHPSLGFYVFFLFLQQLALTTLGTGRARNRVSGSTEEILRQIPIPFFAAGGESIAPRALAADGVPAELLSPG